jgi:hypothetical protein
LLQTNSEDLEESGNLSSDVGVFWMGNIGPKEPMFNNIVGLSSLSSLASFRTTGFGLGPFEGLAVGLWVGGVEGFLVGSGVATVGDLDGLFVGLIGLDVGSFVGLYEG